jgi:uncharacterized membrane protein
MFAGMTAVTLRNFRALWTGYDLGYFARADWMIQHGRTPYVAVRGLNMLGDHSYWIEFPIAYALKPFPGAESLLILQALALAGCIPVLYRLALAMGIASPVLTWGLLGSFAINPAVWNLTTDDYHPECLVIVGIFGFVLLVLRDRTAWAWLPLVTVLANREESSLTVAFLGVLLLIHRARDGSGWSRMLTAQTTASFGIFVFDLKWALPHFSGGSYAHSDQLAKYGDTLGAALTYLAEHPDVFLRDLFTPINLQYLIAIMLPVLFLPVLRFDWFLPVVPVQILLLLSVRPAAHTITSQYQTLSIGFVYLAAMAALGNPRVSRNGIDRPAAERARAVRALGARLTATVVVASVLAWGAWGIAYPNATPSRWDAQDARLAAVRAALRIVPTDARVSATPGLWPFLFDRSEMYSYPRGTTAPYQVDWYVIMTTDPIVASYPVPADWPVVYSQGGIEVAKRPGLS